MLRFAVRVQHALLAFGPQVQTLLAGTAYEQIKLTWSFLTDTEAYRLSCALYAYGRRDPVMLVLRPYQAAELWTALGGVMKIVGSNGPSKYSAAQPPLLKVSLTMESIR